MKQILDNGYVELIETWGSDASIIEAARMSTNKGFQGWGQKCTYCNGEGKSHLHGGAQCLRCDGKGGTVGDEKLLAFLYNNKHSTPFEMAGMIIEVKAPIFVFREWHRHRTQSYNEMSARYTPLPDDNYLPTPERCMVVNGTNKQAGRADSAKDQELTHEQVLDWLHQLVYSYKIAQEVYESGLRIGIPKELARLPVPVGRYSRMRASANLRNWLAFMTLRMAPNAQWEIREYANAVSDLISKAFPRTHELFMKEFNHGGK